MMVNTRDPISRPVSGPERVARLERLQAPEMHLITTTGYLHATLTVWDGVNSWSVAAAKRTLR